MVAITAHSFASEALISRTPSTGNSGAGFSGSGIQLPYGAARAEGFTPSSTQGASSHGASAQGAPTQGDGLGSHPFDTKKPLVNPETPTDRRFVPLNNPHSRHTFCMEVTDPETGTVLTTIPDTAVRTAYASTQALLSGSKD